MAALLSNTMGEFEIGVNEPKKKWYDARMIRSQVSSTNPENRFILRIRIYD